LLVALLTAGGVCGCQKSGTEAPADGGALAAVSTSPFAPRAGRADPAARPVMILCPSTHKPVATGLSMTKTSHESTEFGRHALTCPHCGQEHAWATSDTFLEGDTPPEPAS
jgi:hypothetical protein